MSVLMYSRIAAGFGGSCDVRGGSQQCLWGLSWCLVLILGRILNHGLFVWTAIVVLEGWGGEGVRSAHIPVSL